MAKDDLVMGDMGLTMEEAENLIAGLEAKNKQLEAEVARLHKPGFWKRIFGWVGLNLIIPVVITLLILGTVVGIGYGIYYSAVIRPNQLADEAAKLPVLTDEQLIDYANAVAYSPVTWYWDNKQVILVYHGGDVKFLHLNQEDYNFIKSLQKIDLVQLAKLRELKRQAREKTTPTDNKPPRAEY